MNAAAADSDTRGFSHNTRALRPDFVWGRPPQWPLQWTEIARRESGRRKLGKSDLFIPPHPPEKKTRPSGAVVVARRMSGGLLLRLRLKKKKKQFSTSKNCVGDGLSDLTDYGCEIRN